MNVTVYSAREKDQWLQGAKSLGRKYRHFLGFFPDGAYDDYAQRDLILVAAADDTVVGYLCYRVSRSQVVLVHLCVDTDSRGRGIAHMLVSELKRRTSGCLGIVASCRQDYPANSVWPRLGFAPHGERIGRGKQPKKLTVWWLDYHQPNLFSVLVEDKSVAVLDVNVVFDLQDPVTLTTSESKALMCDWLRDVVALTVTDEVYHEVHRSPKPAERERRKMFASAFETIPYDHEVYADARAQVEQLFRTPLSIQDQSDINQLAKAIAANASFFVTRDGDLLDKADRIESEFGLTIVRPSELVCLTDEKIREPSYRAGRLSGSQLELRRVSSKSVSKVVEQFLDHARGERKSQLERLVHNAIAHPDDQDVWTFGVHGDPYIALMVVSRETTSAINIPVLRIRRGLRADVLGRHLAWKAASVAVAEERLLTVISDLHLSQYAYAGLRAVLFTERKGQWLKFAPQTVGSAKDVALTLEGPSMTGEPARLRAEISQLLREEWSELPVNSRFTLERALWPAKILEAGWPSFIVPIRPGWAMQLFEERIASGDLFGAPETTMLRVENVYYRAARPSVLEAPGRVMWYVSYSRDHAHSKQLAGSSYVCEVVTGPAKVLYREYRRLGVYDWTDVLETAGGDPDQEIMAFRFSHTELFDYPIAWNDLLSILGRHGHMGQQLQGPLRIETECYHDLYLAGTRKKR